MSAWGTSLYSNDSASDIRGDYVDKLRYGKTNEVATQELIDENHDIMGNVEEEPLFWFALADMQWNYGRLLPEVREKALYFLSQDKELERWKESGQKQLNAWKKTIETLKEKLDSPQPPAKKVSKYHLYQCKWKLGDVFAYRLESDLAKARGLYGRYFLIQKVDEGIWHPGHTVPIIYVKITGDTHLPSNAEEYNRLGYIQTGFTRYEERFWPLDMRRPQQDIAEKSKLNYPVDEYGFLPQYRVKLLNTSKRVIPTELIYVGNFANTVRPPKEFVPHAEESIVSVAWKQGNETFETKMLTLYGGHNLREFGIYTDKNL